MNSADGLRQAILRNVLGVPSDEGLRSAYWLRRAAPAKLSELEASRCGLLWLAPVVPLSAGDVGRAVATLEAGLSRRGFEPCLSLQCMTERCAYAVASISYDRDEPGADERASACHRELTRELVAQGFPPYRLSIDAMGVLREQDAPTTRFAQALRDAADPRRVLAPGRYEAGASRGRRGGRR
ncbi:MAG TPA: hypothetical protein VFS00_17605 [Polyangiaceae bacterium]|nr:hypothetical protein [Polyangiaceae bacterium]